MGGSTLIRGLVPCEPTHHPMTKAEQDEAAYQHVMRWVQSGQRGDPLPLPPHPDQKRMWELGRQLDNPPVESNHASNYSSRK